MSDEKKNRKRHRDSVQSKWRSSFLEPQMEHHLGDTATVPSAGWYGFFFGPEKQEKNDNGDRASSVHAAGFHARFHLGDESTTLNLPWNDLADERSPEKVPILDIRVGFRIYLAQGTEVSVVRRDSTEMLQPSIRWQLVLFRTQKLNHADSGVSQASIVSFSESSKSLVCALCLRSFGSVKSVFSHVQSAHSRSLDRSSIWNRPLDIVYQDEILAVIDKPQGMPVMGSKQSLMRSDLLLPLAAGGNSPSALRKPVPVHRLDSGTGGLLVVAKTKEAEQKLKACFAEQKCRKQYHAVVFGKLDMPANHKGGGGPALLSDIPIQGKPATTFYRVLKHTRSADPMATDEWLTTVLLFPTTGRRHQLRRHLREAGHSIWGDRRYARYPKEDDGSEKNGALGDMEHEADFLSQATVESKPHCRLCLWATAISFPHPVSDTETSVALCSEPEWLGSLLRYQEALWKERHSQNDLS